MPFNNLKNKNDLSFSSFAIMSLTWCLIMVVQACDKTKYQIFLAVSC